MINRNVEHLNAEFTELVNQQEDIMNISHNKHRQAGAEGSMRNSASDAETALAAK